MLFFWFEANGYLFPVTKKSSLINTSNSDEIYGLCFGILAPESYIIPVERLRCPQCY